MSNSTELRCIVGAMSCESCGHARSCHDLDDACAECECRAYSTTDTLGDALPALVALVAACERAKEWDDTVTDNMSFRDVADGAFSALAAIESALAAVHAVKEQRMLGETAPLQALQAKRIEVLETALRDAYLALESTARHMPADAKPDVLPLAARLRTLVDG